MGNRVVKFEFIPGESEQIEANIIVPKETRSIIHGVVRHCDGEVIKEAIVRLFEVNFKNKESLSHVANTFTDEDGEFLFGPLCSKKHYVIKVWANSNKIKELLIIPDEICTSKDVDIETKKSYEDGRKTELYTHGFYCNNDCDDEYDDESQ